MQEVCGKPERACTARDLHGGTCGGFQDTGTEYGYYTRGKRRNRGVSHGQGCFDKRTAAGAAAAQVHLPEIPAADLRGRAGDPGCGEEHTPDADPAGQDGGWEGCA